MKKLSVVCRSMIFLLLTGAVALASSATGEVPSIVSLKMESNGGAAKCIIEKLGDVEVQEFQLKNPRRLVLDFIGARHQLGKNIFRGDGNLVDQVRTAQFTNSPQEVSRVVFDLKSDASYRVATSGNRVIVDIFKGANTQSSPDQKIQTTQAGASFVPSKVQNPVRKPISGSQSPVGTTAQPSVPTTAPTPSAWNARVPVPQASSGQVAEKSKSPEASIASAWRKGGAEELARADFNQESGGYTPMGVGGGVNNRPMSIDAQNADIKSILRSISEFSSRNIISGPEVTGPVTAHLKNVPWRQALSIILKSHGFDFREENGIIRVSTMEKLMEEELTLQSADREKDKLLPLETRVVQLSYANAEEMSEALKKMVTQRGSIEVEEGSNALVVTDIKKNIDDVEKLATQLDKKIDQVEIVAKMVDVDFEATREFGVRWDALNLAPANVSVLGDGVVDALTVSPVGRFRVGTVQSWGEVQTIIDMLERENKANIISNPRIVTTDNRQANILVGKQIPLIVSDEAGNPITELTKIGISLRVTPHVNTDNSITMDLHPEISELSAQATVQGGVIISISEADTRVVVADGETAVIGGLINEVESIIENGVPVLKDIPFLGNLFKFKNETTKKREMIIFVTPRIVGPAIGATN